MSYKKPDLKKRRVRKSSFSIIDNRAIAEFRREYPEHRKIKFGEFGKVLMTFNENIIDGVIENTNGISLPELIGKLVILSFPETSSKVIDFGESNKTGVKTYKRNWETDGRICKIVYSTAGHTMKYSYLWGLVPSKVFKKKVSDHYKRYWAKYLYVNHKGLGMNDILK